MQGMPKIATRTDTESDQMQQVSLRVCFDKLAIVWLFILLDNAQLKFAIIRQPNQTRISVICVC